jgi:hypothetical protein
MDELIAKYGKTDPQEVWINVWSMEELFHCNKEYIKNNLTESFYSFGELAPDSKLLMNDLVELHDYGVFTCNGQGAIMNEYTQQRPYLDCFVKNEHNEKLIEYLNNIKIKGERIYYIISTFKSGKFITNMPYTIHNLTRIKKDKNDEWECPTNKELNRGDFGIFLDYCNDCSGIYEDFINDYFHLFISSNRWGSKTSIEKILLDYFKANDEKI